VFGQCTGISLLLSGEAAFFVVLCRIARARPPRFAAFKSSSLLPGHGRPTLRGRSGCRGSTLALPPNSLPTPPPPQAFHRTNYLSLNARPASSHSKTLSSFSSSFTTFVAIHRLPALSSNFRFLLPFVVIVCHCLFLRSHFLHRRHPIPRALPLAPARFESRLLAAPTLRATGNIWLLLAVHRGIGALQQEQSDLALELPFSARSGLCAHFSAHPLAASRHITSLNHGTISSTCRFRCSPHVCCRRPTNLWAW